MEVKTFRDDFGSDESYRGGKAMSRFVFNERKLAELVVFFSKSSIDDALFDSVKLNKLLFLTDFRAYGHLGIPITGTEYVHQQFGPAPQSNQILRVFDRLQAEGRLKIEEEETYSGVRRKPVALDDPDMSLFSQDEQDIARDAYYDLRYMSGLESSQWSHTILGWLHTSIGETIPYQSAFLWQKQPVTIDSMLWAWRKAVELGFVPETSNAAA
jgi:hypothetical protein